MTPKEQNEPDRPEVDLDDIPNEGVTLYAQEFFNIDRHDLITGTALQFCSESTREAIQEFFTPIGATFDDAGGWADRIKSPNNKPNDQETKDFLADPLNKSHKSWHYVNLPLGLESYAAAAEAGFTRENDVVQMARQCVEVLLGESDRFSTLNALRLVGHLIGDIHQPLHIGCGFIDPSTDPPSFVHDPAAVTEGDLDSDTGGNVIALPGAGKMHSYWDAGLGGLIHSIPTDGQGDAPDPEELRRAAFEKLRGLVQSDIAAMPPGAQADDPGPVTDWPEQWANTALDAAREAYSTLEISQKVVSASGKVTYKVNWEGKAKYNERCGPILQEQMTASARHLAELLDAVFDQGE